jgi:RNase H-fold protein (predicted Holliday junction resolvase)
LFSGLDLPYEFVDESYSSQEADEYIATTGKTFSSNDSVAACIILERYFASKRQHDV